MIMCSICKKPKSVVIKTPPTCSQCYNKSYQRKKIKCSSCLNMKTLHCKDGNNGYLCDKCYRNKKYTPVKKICRICNTYDIIKLSDDFGFVCKKCYLAPHKLCFYCNIQKEICHKNNNRPMCRGCYNKDKRKNNENFRIMAILRARLYAALKLYSEKGKIRSSDNYGISYDLIIEHLKPFPINAHLYHIDHIIPLCAFNLNDDIQIQAAFAPENHQWLKREQNMSKNGKYDKNKLKQYLHYFKNKLKQ